MHLHQLTLAAAVLSLAISAIARAAPAPAAQTPAATAPAPAAQVAVPPLSAPTHNTIVVEAGKFDRRSVPMSVALPEGMTMNEMKPSEVMDGDKKVLCQESDGKLWWIVDEIAAGASKSYAFTLQDRRAVGMHAAPAQHAPNRVVLTQLKDTIDVALDGKPLTSYHFTLGKFAGQEAHRPFFHPLLGPGQVPMTRPWPCTDAAIPATVSKDHPHHTGLWVAYGEVNGVDNWTNDAKAGWQIHKSFENVTSGPVMGAFRETLDWTDAAKKPNLAEVRTIRVYALPGEARMIDIEVTLQAKYGPVLFGDTKEGSLCAVRIRDELCGDKGGRLVNSAGLAGADAWGKPAAWIDDSGAADGRRVGLAMFDSPENMRHPTRWHARTYGLLGPNPFGITAFDPKSSRRGDFTLDDGKSVTFRYRICLHAGDEKEGAVAARWADFAQPPAAVVQKGIVNPV